MRDLRRAFKLIGCDSERLPDLEALDKRDLDQIETLLVEEFKGNYLVSHSQPIKRCLDRLGVRHLWLNLYSRRG